MPMRSREREKAQKYLLLIYLGTRTPETDATSESDDSCTRFLLYFLVQTTNSSLLSTANHCGFTTLTFLHLALNNDTKKIVLPTPSISTHSQQFVINTNYTNKVHKKRILGSCRQTFIYIHCRHGLIDK